ELVCLSTQAREQVEHLLFLRMAFGDLEGNGAPSGCICSIRASLAATKLCSNCCSNCLKMVKNSGFPTRFTPYIDDELLRGKGAIHRARQLALSTETFNDFLGQI